ncbi:MAG: tetratricopeptide repeat protein [Cyanobacteria bacterium P01_D01_bin.44]
MRKYSRRQLSGLIKSRRSNLIFTLTLGLTFLQPFLHPAPAEACFFWQSCAQRLGQASNTRVGGKRTGYLRGGNDPSVPYVISPRNTWVGEDRPAPIRWNPVEGSRRYTVRLWQWPYERDLPNLMLWETVVEGTNEVAFPDIALALGAYYSIEVVTEHGVSSNLDEGAYHAGFQQLSAEDYEGLRSHLAQVNTENASAPAEAAALAQAGVYFLDELYAEALQILEPLTLSPTASDLVYIALGDIYHETGLNQLTMEAYGQALDIATANDDTLSKATVQVKLADVYVTLGDFDQARQLLTQARQAYSQIGAQLEISILERRISLLSGLEPE